MKSLIIILLVSLVLLTACGAPASAPQTVVEDSASQVDSRITELEKELKAKEDAIAKLQQQMQEQERRLDSLTTPPPQTAPPEPARFVLAELTITPTAVMAGETVTISIAVSNTGGTESSYTVACRLKLEWTPIEQGDEMWWHVPFEDVVVTLNPGQTKTVTFTTKGQDRTDASGLPQIIPGTYTVDVNGKVGQFTVTAPQPTPTQPEQEQVIQNLAYIKVSVRNYSDDADPEPEGISLGISFYDSESRLIFVSNVPLTVAIKLYYLGQFPKIPEPVPEGRHRTPSYEDKLAINYSISQGIRIPFESLNIRSGKVTSFHQFEAQVTVTTPNQGDFSVTSTGIVDLN